MRFGCSSVLGFRLLFPDRYTFHLVQQIVCSIDNGFFTFRMLLQRVLDRLCEVRCILVFHCMLNSSPEHLLFIRFAACYHFRNVLVLVVLIQHKLRFRKPLQSLLNPFSSVAMHIDPGVFQIVSLLNPVQHFLPEILWLLAVFTDMESTNAAVPFPDMFDSLIYADQWDFGALSVRVALQRYMVLIRIYVQIWNFSLLRIFSNHRLRLTDLIHNGLRRHAALALPLGTVPIRSCPRT